MPKLIARNGDREGTEYQLEQKSFILGRSGNADIQVPSVKASRKHAEIYFEAGAFRVRDMGSSNGTLLNKQRLTETMPLSSGDRIQIGHNVLEFFDENAPPIKVAEDEPAPAGAFEEARPSGSGIEVARPNEPDNSLVPLIIALALAVVFACIGAYVLASMMKGCTGPAAIVESGPPTQP
ncbi:MAG: FHA domain-containing protein [Planctomycetota bacterium]|jgi:hypothetical protein